MIAKLERRREPHYPDSDVYLLKMDGPETEFPTNQYDRRGNPALKNPLYRAELAAIVHYALDHAGLLPEGTLGHQLAQEGIVVGNIRIGPKGFGAVILYEQETDFAFAHKIAQRLVSPKDRMMIFEEHDAIFGASAEALEPEEPLEVMLSKRAYIHAIVGLHREVDMP